MSILEYSSCIKIDFDKAILTDVSTIVPSVEQRLTDFVPAVSGTYSSYPIDSAFDGSTSTYWRASSTSAGQWIGFSTAKKTTLSKIRVYFGYSSGRPNAYVVRGSNDNSTWTDVISGNFTNASAWQEITCSGYKFKYWRLVFDSKFSSYYSCSEIQFYELVLQQGWLITGEEYTTEPIGEAIDKEYTIDKITKSEDNKSLYVWLDLGNRMKFPRSVTVNFSGLLTGPGGAQVEPFIETFTPVGITPIFNPNAPDHLTITSDFALTVKEVVYSSAKLDEPADRIGIFPSSMSITVIHVGTSPL